MSAFFCFLRPVQAEKCHPQDNVTIRCVWVDFETSPHGCFGVGRISLQIVDVTDSEYRSGIPPAAHNDGLLEGLHRLFQMSQIGVHDSQVIQGFKIAWE